MTGAQVAVREKRDGKKHKGRGSEHTKREKTKDREQVLLEIEHREHDSQVAGELGELLGHGGTGVVGEGRDSGRKRNG